MGCLRIWSRRLPSSCTRCSGVRSRYARRRTFVSMLAMGLPLVAELRPQERLAVDGDGGQRHEATAALEFESMRAEIAMRAACRPSGVPPGDVREVILELLLDVRGGIEKVANGVVLRLR